MTDAERIAGIRERCERATPGKWIADEYGSIHTLPIKQKYSEPLLTASEDGSDARFMEPSDAVFAANARDDVPFLLDKVARLQSALDAEKKRAQAAKSDIEGLLGQEYWLGVCWACAKFNDMSACKIGGHECKPEWRGPDTTKGGQGDENPA
jgi:hypothetical protein